MSATHPRDSARDSRDPPRARSRGVRFAQPSIAALPKTSTTRCPGSSRGALRGDDALAASILGGSTATRATHLTSRKPTVVVAAAGGASQTAKGRMRRHLGASGFVGSRLVAKLLAGGHEVRVLTRDVNAARMALRGSMTGGNVTFVSRRSGRPPSPAAPAWST